MKNLKKVLALALAVIMMMSLFTVAFAAETETKLVASDFTDWNEVEYKDAVALAVDLGIINGISNGDGTYKFAPKDSIDRASWAKLIYFIATGDDDASAYKGANVGMTDISTSWAEGYIAYCVANNYAAGDGLGHFLPANTTTVSAGLKTLLTVLGYDADKEGYQGTTTWAANVMTDAKKYGLMDDVAKSNTALSTLTREVAAQIIYNALQTETVEIEEGRDNGTYYVVKYNPTGMTLAAENFDVHPIVVHVSDVNNGVATFGRVTGESYPYFMNGNFTTLNDAEIAIDPSMKGTNVTVFVKKEGSNKYSVASSIVTAVNGADVIFTDGVALDNIFTKTTDYEGHFVAGPYDSDNDNSADKDDVTYYLNDMAPAITDSKTMKGDATTTATGNNIPDAIEDAAIKAGNKVEVYLTDGKVSMIKVYEYSFARVTDDVATRVYNKEDQVKIPGVLAGWTDQDVVSGWEDLEDGDVVMVYTSKPSTSNAMTYITKADKVTGSVSKKTTSKITVDGAAYKKSGVAYTNASNKNTDGELDIVSWGVKSNKDNTYDFYLDIDGNITYVVLVDGEVETEVAYILEDTWVTGSGLAASQYMEAKLLFTDGTTEIVTVDKVGGKTVVKDAVAVGGDNATKVAYTTLADKFIDFSVDSDGEYSVTVKSTTSASVSNAIKAQPKFNQDSIVADSNTVFLVKKGTGKDATYHTYTSYKNLPGMTATTLNIFTNTTTGNVAYAYLETTKFDGEGSDGLIYATSSNTTTDADNFVWYTFVDGKGNETEMALDISSIGAWTVGTFYKIDTINEDGVGHVATTSSSDWDVTGKVGFKAGNTVLNVYNEVGCSTLAGTYSYDDETVVVVVDENSSHEFVAVETASLDKLEMEANYTYEVTVVCNTDKVAEYVYIIRTATI